MDLLLFRKTFFFFSFIDYKSLGPQNKPSSLLAYAIAFRSLQLCSVFVYSINLSDIGLTSYIVYVPWPTIEMFIVVYRLPDGDCSLRFLSMSNKFL